MFHDELVIAGLGPPWMLSGVTGHRPLVPGLTSPPNSNHFLGLISFFQSGAEVSSEELDKKKWPPFTLPFPLHTAYDSVRNGLDILDIPLTDVLNGRTVDHGFCEMHLSLRESSPAVNEDLAHTS